MINNYKEYNKSFLGVSDISRLTLVSPEKTQFLNFGGDSAYYAYIVTDKNCIIPNHYTLKGTFNTWLWVFDDNERTYQIRADIIEIYRAGDHGCIIKRYNE